MEYPRLVYRCPVRGAAFSHKAVADDAERTAALADGWFDSVPEAIAGVSAAMDNAPPTRTELEQKAGQLGIRFDRKTTDKALMALISEATG